MSVKSQNKKGFTIIEMLISLIIMALLLSALAAAINASMINYKVNEDSFKAINTARQVLTRITTELRTANAVAVSEAAGQCSMVTSDSRDITYSFDSDAETLIMITNDDLADDDYIMCEGVTAMTFTKGLDPADPGVVRNVRISLTVKSGSVSKSISTAAVVRRNMP